LQPESARHKARKRNSVFITTYRNYSTVIKHIPCLSEIAKSAHFNDIGLRSDLFELQTIPGKYTVKQDFGYNFAAF
jgi:hypothetical protein